MTDQRSCPTCRASYSEEFAVCPRDGTPLEAGVDLLVGAQLRETYQITHVLGAGGLGRVYHAVHLRMPRSYAVKVPRGMWVDHPKARARFVHEALAAGRLAHPHVASVLDVGELNNGLPYLVMELAPGAPLAELLHEPLPVREALGLLRQIASGLAHAHAHGVIHRDLKPDNVLVHAGHARIVDFGIAIVTDLGEEGRLTTKGSAIGTPHYMAPEQLFGGAVDCRADLYALGAMLYEMLAGCRPYTGDTVEYVQQVVGGKLPRFAERVPWLVIDPRVEELCRALMARTPAERPIDAEAAITMIDELLEQLSTPPARSVRGSRGGYAPQSKPAILELATQPTMEVQALRVRWWNPFTWRRRQ